MKEEEFDDRFRRAYEATVKLLDEYQSKSPDWSTFSLLERMVNALESLRLYVEDPEREEVSWERPSAILFYSLPWDFERSRPGVRFTPRDFEGKERLKWKLVDVFRIARDLQVFGPLTKWAAIGIEKGEAFPMVPLDLQEELQKLPRKRGWELLDKLYEPVEISFPFSGEARGEVKFTFYPLQVDYDRREAGFPVSVELSFEGEEHLGWSGEERRKFWESLLRPFKEEEKRLSPWVRLEGEALPAPYFRAPSDKPNYFMLPFWGTFQPQVVEQHGQKLVIHYRYQGDGDTICFQQVFDDPVFHGYEVSRIVNRALGAEGLKVWDGLLWCMDENNRQPYFVLEKNDFLDRLGYKRRREKGGFYHQAKNLAMLERTLQVLQGIEIVGELMEGRGKRRRTRRISGRLIYITSKLEEWDHLADQPPEGGVKVFDGMVIQMNPFLYEGIRRQDGSLGNRYTWIPKTLPGESARKHALTIYLMNYYPLQWRMQRAKGGILRRKLSTILNEAGINTPSSSKNRARFLERLMREHDYMVERGYIGGWRIYKEFGGDFLEDVWEVTAPPDFPLLAFPGRGRGKKAIGGRRAEPGGGLDTM